MNEVFAVWRDRGLATLGDLYIDKQFAYFNQLKTKFNIPNSHFYVKDKIPNFENKPKICPFFELL